MPTKATIHTFKKGMVKDLDRSLLTNEAYLDASNLRIVTGVGESTGALENIEGNNHTHPLDVNAICPDGYKVVGSCLVRDTLVLFITNETNSRIITVEYNEATETVGTVTTIYDDSLNNSAGLLNFSIDYPIKTIARYETPNIQKIYWTDGYNNIRYADITKNLTITGEPYTVNNYMDPKMFEFLPPFTPTKPVLLDIVGGRIMSGMVQYAYQLYRLNGAGTAFSPVSNIIHIVSESDFYANTLNYRGDFESTVTGKGCKMSIVNNDTGYNRLRLVRIHYSSLDAVPLIDVVSEVEININPSTVVIIDIGDSINSLTLDEFNIFSTELFKCEDIATKNNRLFAANIEKEEFVVDDWDARAVRFRDDSEAYLIDSVPANNITITADLANWDDYTEYHDGINEFNDTDNDGNLSCAYKYQSNGITLGAEGLNIKIDFATETFFLDNSNRATTFYTTKHDWTGVPAEIGRDLSYYSHASPWGDGKMSWQRDEVYRLFVVFGNDRGQTSNSKWICDLRMPSLHDENFVNSSSDTVYPSKLADGTTFPGNVMSSKLYPRVYFKSFPANAIWAQIHRVKRGRSDRFVVTQGFSVPTQAYGTGYQPNSSNQPNLTTNGVELIKLVSPEININKNITKQSDDYIEYVTYFTGAGVLTTTSSPGDFNSNTYKLITNTKVPYVNSVKSNINGATTIEPNIDNGVADNIILNGKTYYNYHTVAPGGARGCSGFLVSYDNTSWSAEGKAFTLINYKSNVFGSQYGGHTYENRMLNISIPCSGVISTEGEWHSIKGGDTFINYFDVSTLLYDLINYSDIEHSTSEVVYVPVESSVNCDLRHDKDSQHITYDTLYSVLRQEYAGEHIFVTGSSTTPTYVQKDNLYLYNTVYSQQTSVQNAISESLDQPNETVFDCLVKVSKVKYNGENSDSWTKFGFNEELEVDSGCGEITALHNFNDRLLFWQEHGFGILSVNERSLINEGSTSQLVLGTGGVLDRYDYVSSSIGTNNRSTLIQSQSGMYWFDPTDKSMYRFSNSLTNLSKNKLIQSWFNNNYLTSHRVHGIFDNKYNEVLVTLYGASSYTVVYNEATDAFISFYSFQPRIYIPYTKGYFTVNFEDNADAVYCHNSLLANRCTFYGTVFDSTIKLLFNEDYAYTKVFDNAFYASTTFSTSGYEQHNISFSNIRCYNTLQNTGYTTLTLGGNLERREREWTLAVPRNSVNVVYPTNVDILDPVNLDTTRLYRDRMRDKYLIVDLTYTNSGGRRFICPYFGMKYRVSNR